MFNHLPSPDDLVHRFAAAKPTRFFVIDDFLPRAMYLDAMRDFPMPSESIWLQYKSGKENKKLQSRDLTRVKPALQRVLRGANRQYFVGWLGRATGMLNLLADPEYSGGGLHQTLRGGHLGVHIDYNLHTTRRWHRRLNAILFLNETWDERWGGALELWDRDMRHAVERFSPIGNRLVVFETGEHSWHGHPDPLDTPPGVTRKSIATYYYTVDRPADEIAPWHNTVFRARPGERFRKTLRERAGEIVRAIR